MHETLLTIMVWRTFLLLFNYSKLRVAAYCRVSTDSDEQLIKLQQELLDKASKRQDYDDSADEILQLREKKAKTNIDTSARDEQIGRITELQNFIKKQSTELTEFDENLARRWLKKITVYEDKYTVEFKSGVSVDIEG